MLTVKILQNTYLPLRYLEMNIMEELILVLVIILLISILDLQWCLTDYQMITQAVDFQVEAVQITTDIMRIMIITIQTIYIFILTHTRNVNKIKDNTTRGYQYQLEFHHQEINNQFQKHRWSLKSMETRWEQIK